MTPDRIHFKQAIVSIHTVVWLVFSICIMIGLLYLYRGDEATQQDVVIGWLCSLPIIMIVRQISLNKLSKLEKKYENITCNQFRGSVSTDRLDN